MKINNINIVSFGGIKNFSLNFSDGFNVIYGDNENGKTTVMSFIKMMFYGNERGSAIINKNPRKKYTPWDGSAMAGSINFEHSGRKYRLEREFRSSNSTDKLNLCDLDLGTREVVTGDIGTKFFGLSPAAFERSVFIGQFGFFEKDANADGEINSKLSNIVSTGDESTSYETVNSRLDKAKLALMSKSGRAGEYDKNILAISQLEDRLEKAKSAQNNLQSFKNDIGHLKEEIELMQKKSDQLKSKINTEQDVRNASKLKDMLLYKEKLDNLNEKLKLSDGSLIDEVFVRKIVFCISKIDALRGKIEAKSAEAEALRQNIDLATNPSEDISPIKVQQLETEISGLEEEKCILMQKISAIESEYSEKFNVKSVVENSKKMFSLPLLITSIIFICFSAALFIAGVAIFGGVLAVTAIATLILTFVLRPKDIKKITEYQNMILNLKTECDELKSKEADIKQKTALASAQLETIKTALNSNSALIENQKQRLAECRELILSENQEMNAETQTLIALFSRYKPAATVEEIQAQLEDINLKADKQKELKQQLNYIIKDVGNISYQEAKEKLDKLNLESGVNIDDFESLKQEYSNLTAQITDKKTSLASLVTEAKGCLENSEDPGELELKIAKLTGKASSQKEFCQIADIAMQVLADSFAELRRSYGSVLEQKSGEVFTGITGGAYQSMSVSKSFEINVEKSGVFGGKSLDYLSSGTADQAYLSLRLALSALISETSNESLPILLDDALTQYDDARIKTALDYLNKYSENEQIIMFTCHHSILEAAKSAGADCGRL